MNLQILKKLQYRLNGKCHSHGKYYCPRQIAYCSFNRPFVEAARWCDWCLNNFDWLRQDDNYTYTCPCKMVSNKGEVIQHLNDIIEEMEGT